MSSSPLKPSALLGVSRGFILLVIRHVHYHMLCWPPHRQEYAEVILVISAGLQNFKLAEYLNCHILLQFHKNIV